MKGLTKKQIQSNPNNEFRLRIMRAMADLPKQWLKVYLDKYPSENNIDGINKIRNVAAMRSFDLSRINKLESLAEYLKES